MTLLWKWINIAHLVRWFMMIWLYIYWLNMMIFQFAMWKKNMIHGFMFGTLNHDESMAYLFADLCEKNPHGFPWNTTPMAPKGLTFKEISLGKVKILGIIGDQVTWEGRSIKGLDVQIIYVCILLDTYTHEYIHVCNVDSILMSNMISFFKFHTCYGRLMI